MKNVKAEIFRVPERVMPTQSEIAELLKKSVRVRDRGGWIGLEHVDDLNYRVATGGDIQRIVPSFVQWMDDEAWRYGRRLDYSDPEFVALNVVPVSGSYAPHKDTTTSAVLIVFLNEVHEGGELFLTDLGISIRPVRALSVYLRGREILHEIKTVEITGANPRLTLVANLSGDDDHPPPEADYRNVKLKLNEQMEFAHRYTE